MSRISSTFGKHGDTSKSTNREITMPNGIQPAQTHEWKQTLRDSQDKSLNSSLKKSNSFNNLRKSTGNLSGHMSENMSGKLNKTTNSDIERIEAEYIKNLQQQVYFLELEANYLREQSRKATEIHPHMTAEAERMLSKLRAMQAEVDGLHLELKRKESSITVFQTEKEKVLSKLKTEEDTHSREKRLLLDEVVQVRKEKDLLERDNSRKDTQILLAREELDKTVTALRSSETKLQMLRNQVEQLTDQNRLTQSALEEKRSEVLKTETMLREIEDKYYSSSVTIQEKVVQDLRDEIRHLRQKLKESELGADQDRYLRGKLADDSSHLVKENARLNQQVIELQKQMDRERELRDSTEARRSANISELVASKDREKTLGFELNNTREELKHAQERMQHYMEKLQQQESAATSVKLSKNSIESRLAELEAMKRGTEEENAQLRRDKVLLVDHVADLQKQLETRERESVALHSNIRSLEARLKELEQLKGLESSLHSQKWDEFSRLADSMKSLSRSMAATTTMNGGATGRLADYS